MFNKILVAIDTSATKNIFDAALSLAQTTGAKLMLLNIIAPNKDNYPNPFIYSGYEYDLMDESLATIYQEQWQKSKHRGLETLRSLAEEATAAGVEVGYTQDFGNPGRTICDRAKSWSADTILIGTRGLTGVREMFLGSVSNYVTHHAPCSVFLVRETIDSSELERNESKLDRDEKADSAAGSS